MLKWVYYNAATIQAVCSIFGIIGLFIYAWDTSQIRRATLAQSRASRRPFLRFLNGQYPLLPMFGWNDGPGIALNIRWRFYSQPDDTWLTLSAWPPSTSKSILRGNERIESEEVIEKGGLMFEYEDTAGVRYWTVLKVVNKEEFLYTVDTGTVQKRYRVRLQGDAQKTGDFS